MLDFVTSYDTLFAGTTMGLLLRGAALRIQAPRDTNNHKKRIYLGYTQICSFRVEEFYCESTRHNALKITSRRIKDVKKSNNGAFKQIIFCIFIINGVPKLFYLLKCAQVFFVSFFYSFFFFFTQNMQAHFFTYCIFIQIYIYIDYV